MSDDLISREQAIDAIGELSDTIFKNIEKGATYPPRAWFAGMASAESIIEGLPSIDAVPVIRCKDCKYKEAEEIGMVYCSIPTGGWVSEDWFCADGERKES